MQGLKHNMYKNMCERALRTAGNLDGDNDAEPIYANHVTNMIMAYETYGTPDVRPPLRTPDLRASSAPPPVRRLLERATPANFSRHILQAVTIMLVILTAWLTIGRTGESAFISFDKMWWDALFNCVFVEIYQFKPGKMKIVPFIVGTTRHLCWSSPPSHAASIFPKPHCASATTYTKRVSFEQVLRHGRISHAPGQPQPTTAR